MEIAVVSPVELARLDEESRANRLILLKEEIYRRSLERLEGRIERLVGELNRQGHGLRRVEREPPSEYRKVEYRDDRSPRFTINLMFVVAVGHGDEVL